MPMLDRPAHQCRRCFPDGRCPQDCIDRNQDKPMEEPFYDSLYLALRDKLPGAEIAEIRPMHSSDEGECGIFLVTLEDGRAYSVHFDKA